jgi:phosphoadenosine phosphosulfate reductase
VAGPAVLTGPEGRSQKLAEELAELSRSFERQPASKVVRWAVDRFHPHLSLLASMTDAVLIDLAVKVEPSIEVVFIDTGHHFPETLETVEAVRRRYGLNLRIVTVGPDPAPLVDGCCSATKVLQLDRALVGRPAWLSGLRRADAPTRAGAPIVGLDPRGLVKVNPLATWTDDDVAGYIAEHDVPVNPLVFQGYPSVGCRPCTRQVAPGDDPRAGRWAGSSRTECGIHG